MKYVVGIVCAVLATAPAGAQPAPPPPAPPPSGTSPADQPSWLPGVQDVNKAETAEPGKLKITMARAVEIAEHDQPTLRQARANAAAAVARVDLARVPLHPTVTLNGTVSTGSTNCNNIVTGTGAAANCGAAFGTGGFFSPSFQTGVSAAASWRIYDFGQTAANVRSAQANSDAAAAGINTSLLDLRVNVESTYLEAVARQRLVLVAQATVRSEELHYDQAKRFVAAQAQDPIAVAQAQSRLANARSALAQADSNAAVAVAQLRAAIGWLDPTRGIAVDPTWPQPSEQQPADLGALVSIARKHRPEIVQFDKLVVASEENITAAHAERRPILSAVAQTQWNPNSNNWSPDPTWTAGVTLSWLAWDGGRSAADVHIAQANMQSALAQRDELLISLTSALDAARAQILANRANVDASSQAVTAAQAALHLADARYTQGLGSQIELADAQTAVTTAEGNLVFAEWQLATAWAQLQRALGEI
ncbi:MAG: outer rane efflux protein [Myxococcales bacterium]|nr:outer rane efflux protein [Myxococcales bacterium]